MSSQVGPVEIGYVLRDTNFKEEAEKMKSEIRGVSVATNQAASVTDQLFERTNLNITQKIALQRQLIREIGGDIANLQNNLNRATTPQAKKDINADLLVARSTLAEQKAVLIGFQGEQVKANLAEEASQGGLISSLGKWAIGLFTVAAAMKIGKDIIESTEGTAKQFEFAVSAAENGLSYFWKTLATGDFSNFFSNMEKAIETGYKYAEMMHEVKEGTWAQSMKEADMLKTNTQLEIDLRNTDLPKDVRLKAGEERIANEKVLAAGRIKVAQEELNAAMMIAEDRSNIDTEVYDAEKRRDDKTYDQKFKLLNILKKVNAETRMQAEGYNQDLDKIKKVDKPGLFNGEFKALSADDIENATAARARIKNVSEEVKLYADALRGYGGLKEEMITNVVDAYKKVGEADNSEISGLKRVFTTVNGVKKQMESEEKAAADKAQTDANRKSKEQIDYDTAIGRQRISMQIENDQTLLSAQADGAEKQRQQAELDYRKTLVDIANQKAALIEKTNLKDGGINKASGKHTGSYVATLQPEDQALFDQKIINAETLKNAAIGKINEKEAENIKEIWQKVTDYRLKGIEKEKAASDAYFDKMQKDALKAGDLLLYAEIEKMRAKANTQIYGKYELEQIDFEQKIETQKNQIQATGFDREAQLLKLNYDTWVLYTQKRIALLKKSPQEKDQQEAQLLQGDLDVANVERKAKLQEQILFGARQFTSELITQAGLGEEETRQLQMAVDIFASALTGNYIAAAFGFLSLITKSLIAHKNELNVYFDSLSEHVTQLVESINNINSALAHMGKGGSAAGLAVLNEEMIKLKNNAALLNSQLVILSIGRDHETSGGTNTGGSGAGRPNSGQPDPNARQKMIVSMIDQYKQLEDQILILNDKLLDPNLTDEQRKAIEDVLKQYNDIVSAIDSTIQSITGTTVNDLSNALADAFLSGEDAAAAWGQKVDDIIKNIIVKSLTAQLLTKPLTDAVNTLITDSTDANGLTPEDALKFKKTVDALYLSAGPVFDATKKALEAVGFNFNGSASSATKTGLTGSAQSATEETVGAMVGQLMAVRVDIKEILKTMAVGQDDLAKNLMYLKQIADNTSYNIKLVSIEQEMKDMNATLKAKL